MRFFTTSKISHCFFPFLLSVCTLCGSVIHGQMIQTMKEGPVHEALVTRVSGDVILEAFSLKPPDSINEHIPRQLDLQSEWIPGYWAWESQFEEFIWVSGVWRRPPPGHQWVPGHWEEVNKEWAWFPGFWSSVASKNIETIQLPPPDPIDENVAPTLEEESFWVPGFWYYMSNREEYQWVPGYWEDFDSNWVFVPSYYLWQGDGYVFIPAYWDWPLLDRGTAYSSVYVEPASRRQVDFEPTQILRPEEIVRRLFLYYPDYIIFFHHYWHFHPQFWEEQSYAPPWWSWDSWWCFTWHDHWRLWWWYTHPGYTQPSWMTAELSSILPAPLPELVSMVAKVNRPFIVMQNGADSSGELLKKILKPTGRRLPIDPQAVRPHVRKPAIDPGALLRVTKVRKKLRPGTPPKPKIPSHKRASNERTQPHPQETPAQAFPVKRPVWTPKGSKASGSHHSYEYSPPLETSRELPRWTEPSLRS